MLVQTKKQKEKQVQELAIELIAAIQDLQKFEKPKVTLDDFPSVAV